MFVYFWWSASYVYSARFVRWVITRMNTGGEDTNKMGVAVMVESDWLFDKCIIEKIPNGCKRGQYILRPYSDIYRSYNDAWNRHGKIRKPSVYEVQQFKKLTNQ